MSGLGLEAVAPVSSVERLATARLQLPPTVQAGLDALERANTVDGLGTIIVVNHFARGKLVRILNEV
jgi:hypothetical protein